MNFEDKVKRERERARERRRMKTLDVFFLLYDIPKVKDIEKKFGYNKNLSSFLHSQLDFLKMDTCIVRKVLTIIANNIVETHPLL